MPREATLRRETKETTIEVTLRLEGRGEVDVATGIGFFDHMLSAWALHGRMDLRCRVEGDLHVSQHHSVEDAGLVLGAALLRALGDKRGIVRYGHAYVPMDEALVRCALDLSGRAYAQVEIPFQPALGPVGFDYALTHEFFWALARGAAMTVHVDGLRGRSNHHLCEAAFKACGQALRSAVALDERLGDALPTTKGAFDGGSP